MLSLGFVMAFIGVAIALLIGVLIFSSVNETINTVLINNATNIEEENSNFVLTIIGLLPLLLFLGLFFIFGSLGRDRSTVSGNAGKSVSILKMICLKFLVIIGLAKEEKADGR